MSAALCINDQPLLLLLFLSYSLCSYTNVLRVFFVSAHYIFTCKCLCQCEQVHVNLHYLSLSFMNSPGFPKPLEYYTSHSANISKVVNTITLCGANLIALLQASFNYLVPPCLSFCHDIKRLILIFPQFPSGSN